MSVSCLSVICCHINTAVRLSLEPAILVVIQQPLTAILVKLEDMEMPLISVRFVTPTPPTHSGFSLTRLFSLGYSFIHDGHCAAGYIADSFVYGTLAQCAQECKDEQTCGYFAHSTTDNSCSMYTSAAECPDDGDYYNFNSYRLQGTPELL